MNVERLRAIKEQILANPQHLNMEAFFCGTTACIAGWAVTLEHEAGKPNADNFKKYHWTADEAAAQWLDLEEAQADRLFFLPCKPEEADVNPRWSWPMTQAYREACRVGDLERAAEIVAERIEHFITTDGNE